MKISKTIVISVVIIEFLIIVLGFLYLQFDFKFFQKKFPAVVVININNEIISTQFFSILEKRGQIRPRATSTYNVIRTLESFSQDKSVKAFILEIDAYGQTAGQEELVRYMKRMDKPIVAVIKGSALSSGYYVAAGADRIYADKLAKIGNMGEVFVYVNRERNGQEQVCSITSVNYKNITLDDCSGFEEDVFNMLKHYVKLTHTTLILHIAQMRQLSVDDIEQLSNTIMTSEQALELGLIDEIGTTDDAVAWLESQLGTKLWLKSLIAI